MKQAIAQDQLSRGKGDASQFSIIWK